MKKITVVFISVFILFLFTACGYENKQPVTNETSSAEETSTQKFDYSAIKDKISSADGKYEIALITDAGILKDKSFNQGTWEGIKRFAYENSKTYKHYQPSGGESTTDQDRYDAMKAAADAGAEIIVCAGLLQKDALSRAAEEYESIKFIFIDGEEIVNENGKILNNVAALNFNEEQAGYLAGYAAVSEGYTRLGFSGGGGGTNEACCRYGYGYIQGAQAAAEERRVIVSMNFSWEYGSTYSASADLMNMISSWYSSGTQVVFVCGGSMCQSVFAAASANDAAVIGVDTDQSTESDMVITSAIKDIRKTVEYALGKAYNGQWSDIGGLQTTFGIKDGAISLPEDTWSMENFTLKEYRKLYKDIKNGYIEILRDYEKGMNEDLFPNIRLNII